MQPSFSLSTSWCCYSTISILVRTTNPTKVRNYKFDSSPRSLKPEHLKTETQSHRPNPIRLISEATAHTAATLGHRHAACDAHCGQSGAQAEVLRHEITTGGRRNQKAAAVVDSSSSSGSSSSSSKGGMARSRSRPST